MVLQLPVSKHSFPGTKQLLTDAFEQRLLTVPLLPFKNMCVLLEKYRPCCANTQLQITTATTFLHVQSQEFWGFRSAFFFFSLKSIEK